MNTLLWILQIAGALLYGASGIMKVFMLDQVREGVQSFDALPTQLWMALGVIELLCVVGLIVPGVLRRKQSLTVVAASVLAIESLLFVWVHVQYRETSAIVMSAVLGLAMAFIAYGRRSHASR